MDPNEVIKEQEVAGYYSPRTRAFAGGTARISPDAVPVVRRFVTYADGRTEVRQRSGDDASDVIVSQGTDAQQKAQWDAQQKAIAAPIAPTLTDPNEIITQTVQTVYYNPTTGMTASDRPSREYFPVIRTIVTYADGRTEIWQRNPEQPVTTGSLVGRGINRQQAQEWQRQHGVTSIAAPPPASGADESSSPAPTASVPVQPTTQPAADSLDLGSLGTSVRFDADGNPIWPDMSDGSDEQQGPPVPGTPSPIPTTGTSASASSANVSASVMGSKEAALRGRQNEVVGRPQKSTRWWNTKTNKLEDKPQPAERTGFLGLGGSQEVSIEVPVTETLYYDGRRVTTIDKSALPDGDVETVTETDEEQKKTWNAELKDAQRQDADLLKRLKLGDTDVPEPTDRTLAGLERHRDRVIARINELRAKSNRTIEDDILLGNLDKQLDRAEKNVDAAQKGITAADKGTPIAVNRPVDNSTQSLRQYYSDLVARYNYLNNQPKSADRDAEMLRINAQLDKVNDDINAGLREDRADARANLAAGGTRRTAAQEAETIANTRRTTAMAQQEEAKAGVAAGLAKADLDKALAEVRRTQALADTAEKELAATTDEERRKLALAKVDQALLDVDVARQNLENLKTQKTLTEVQIRQADQAIKESETRTWQIRENVQKDKLGKWYGWDDQVKQLAQMVRDGKLTPEQANQARDEMLISIVSGKSVAEHLKDQQDALDKYQQRQLTQRGQNTQLAAQRGQAYASGLGQVMETIGSMPMGSSARRRFFEHWLKQLNAQFAPPSDVAMEQPKTWIDLYRMRGSTTPPAAGAVPPGGQTPPSVAQLMPQANETREQFQARVLRAMANNELPSGPDASVTLAGYMSLYDRTAATQPSAVPTSAQPPVAAAQPSAPLPIQPGESEAAYQARTQQAMASNQLASGPSGSYLQGYMDWFRQNAGQTAPAPASPTVIVNVPAPTSPEGRMLNAEQQQDESPERPGILPPSTPEEAMRQVGERFGMPPEVAVNPAARRQWFLQHAGQPVAV